MRRKWNGRLEVLNDPPDLRVVAAADPVDLFDELAVAFHQPGIQRVPLLEALHVLHRDAGVEIVGARREYVLPVPGVLFVTIGSTLASKKSGAIRAIIASSVSPLFVGKRAPAFCAAFAAAANAAGVSFSTNLRAVRLL